MITRLQKGLIALLNKINLKRKKFIHKTAILWNKEYITFGQDSEIWEYAIIRASKTGKVIIGSYSQIGPFTVIFGGAGVEIGNNVLIAPHCVIAAGNHDYKQTDKPMRFSGGISNGPIIIEDDVWIGANCTITDGVTIGEGAVIGANSVITHNVEPFDVVAGVPGKKISNRKKKLTEK